MNNIPLLILTYSRVHPELPPATSLNRLTFILKMETAASPKATYPPARLRGAVAQKTTI